MKLVEWLFGRTGEEGTSTTKLGVILLAAAYVASIWYGTGWMHDPMVDKILASLEALGIGGTVIGLRNALGKKVA